jgi:hypothetical protein
MKNEEIENPHVIIDVSLVERESSRKWKKSQGFNPWDFSL